MPRTPFETILPSSVTYKNASGGGSTVKVNDGSYARESASGVKRRLPDGWKNPTPYALTFLRYTRGDGYARIVWNHTKPPFEKEVYEWTGCVAGRPGMNVLNSFDECLMPWGGYDRSYYASECYRKALVKMQNKKVDLGVAFAERVQTANLLSGAATKCARSVLALKENKLRRAASILGVRPGRDLGPHNWARKWLEWKYGWMPLAQDVKGSIEALSNRGKGDWKITARSSHRKDLRRQIISGSYGTKCLVVSGGFAGVQVRIDSVPPDDLLAALNAVGILNAFNVAYQATRYSFVVDWFVPVGEWLEALGAVAFSQGGTVCISSFCKQEWNAIGLDDDDKWLDWDVSYENSFHSNKRFTQLERTVGPIVVPSFPKPRNGLNSFARMASALALLTVAFKK